MRSGLVRGVNVDRVDVAAGCLMARQIGYGSPQDQMVVEYALMRHARGEEDGAQRTWLGDYPNDLTSWLMILAAALAAVEVAEACDG